MKAKLRSGEISINKAWTQLNKRHKKPEVPSTVSSDTSNKQVSEQSGSITNTSVTSPSFLFPLRDGRGSCSYFLGNNLEDDLDESDELTDTAIVSLSGCSDVEDSLAVISDQPSSVSDISLSDDLESFLPPPLAASFFFN